MVKLKILTYKVLIYKIFKIFTLLTILELRKIGLIKIFIINMQYLIRFHKIN